MTNDQPGSGLRRAATLFVQVLALPEAEREAFLDEACAGNAELREWIEAMLRAREEPGGARPTAEAFGPRPVGERAGDTIGRYKLLQQIGEGGFGVVFMGEQTEPVQRRVALKIIKLGMDTKQVIARFEAERQALAMMEHPNIARVFDAGTTDGGRPYFVMELVKGESITKYCDRNSLTTRERLELVKQVCAAVQHAHRKGVIHRDIKPGNILVTIADGKPVPKVIDFGIAKATNARLTARTLFTEFRQLIGTPEYMSPEQAEASGVDVDTRTDVYSLGVLLYELVTGTTPFDPERLRSAAYAEIQRIIREEEAPRPSMKLNTLGDDLSTVAACRREEPEHLTRVVRGELDWIIMKALEKDRSRRYGSADELGEDIGRYLNDEVVLARPASRAYRARKFVRKHRAGVAAAALVAFAVVAGLVGTGWGYLKSERTAAALAVENEKTTAEAARADAVQEFLLELLRDAKPTADGPGRTVRDLLNDASEKVSDLEQDQPLTAGYVHLALGDIAYEWREDEQAMRNAEQAVVFLSTELGEDHPHTLDAVSNLLSMKYQITEETDILDQYEELVASAERVLGADHEDTLVMRKNLAALFRAAGRTDEALVAQRAVLASQNRLLGDHPETILTQTSLSMILLDAGDPEEALRMARSSMVRLGTIDDAPLTLRFVVENNLAQALIAAGELEEAEGVYASLLDACRSALQPKDPRIAHVLVNYGALRRDLGDLAEGTALIREGVELRREVLPPGSRLVQTGMLELAHSLAREGRDEEAAGIMARIDAARPGAGPVVQRKYQTTHDRIRDSYLDRDELALFERLYPRR